MANPTFGQRIVSADTLADEAAVARLSRIVSARESLERDIEGILSRYPSEGITFEQAESLRREMETISCHVSVRFNRTEEMEFSADLPVEFREESDEDGSFYATLPDGREINVLDDGQDYPFWSFERAVQMLVAAGADMATGTMTVTWYQTSEEIDGTGTVSSVDRSTADFAIEDGRGYRRSV